MSDKKEAAAASIEHPKLMPHRVQLAEQERIIYRCYPEVNTTKEQVMNPEYWTHVGQRLRQGAKIEVLAEDGSYYGELLVVAAEKMWAKTVELLWIDLTGGKPEKLSTLDFEHQYKGPIKKHCIVRKSDGEVLHEGSQTKADALTWLAQNEAVIS